MIICQILPNSTILDKYMVTISQNKSLRWRAWPHLFILRLCGRAYRSTFPWVQRHLQCHQTCRVRLPSAASKNNRPKLRTLGDYFPTDATPILKSHYDSRLGFYPFLTSLLLVVASISPISSWTDLSNLRRSSSAFHCSGIAPVTSTWCSRDCNTVTQSPSLPSSFVTAYHFGKAYHRSFLIPGSHHVIPM